MSYWFGYPVRGERSRGGEYRRASAARALGGGTRWCDFSLLAAVPAAALAAALTFPSAPSAAVLDVTKQITWKAPAEGDLLGEIPATNGSFTWLHDVTAWDDHISLDIPNGGGGDWPVATGLAGLAGGPFVTDTKSLAHPTAKATISFKASGLLSGVVTGSITTHVEAFAADPKAHGKNFAASSSAGFMNMRGYDVTAISMKKGKEITYAPDLKLKTAHGGAGLFVDLIGQGAYHDPVSAGFVDLLTGAVTESPLFSLDASGDGADISWDSTGVDILLAGAAGARADLTFTVLSSWVSDPGLVTSRLSLTHGGFTTTGLFAGLPWVVSGGHVTLAGGYLDAVVVPYLIPDSLITDGHAYATYLSLGDSVGVSEAAPEPSAWALLILGFGLTGAILRRRSSGTAAGPVPNVRA